MIKENGLFRSVIINSYNKVVSFSPPKSIKFEDFVLTNNENNDDNNIVAQEFVEGTMINVFWDELTSDWEISTRSNVGGNTSFYKTNKMKSFRRMFDEACELSDLDIKLLNPNLSYSFVLQHPENRIVVHFKTPALYLVEVYVITTTESNYITVNPLKMEEICEMDIWKNTRVKFPQVYTEWNSDNNNNNNSKNYDELKNKYASMETPYDVLGFILKNTHTNSRTKYRNPVYEIVRKMRGNQPNLHYQYLILRKTGDVSNFLTYYPEYTEDLSFYRECLHKFTKRLYNNYVSCYIKKEKELKEFPENYKTHMFHIHQLFVDIFKPKKLCISLTIVIEYVNNLSVPLQMYSVNYDLRKNMYD